MSSIYPRITIDFTETPIGNLIAGVSDKGLYLLEFMEGSDDLSIEKLSDRHSVVFKNGHTELHTEVFNQLSAYFTHQLTQFDLPLDMHGTTFQLEVWDELLKIPFGKTRSYREQSIAMQKPDAIRAIASANGQNRIAIIVPCHRVLGSDGSLTGYAGGLHRKRWLLDHEAPFTQARLSF